MISFSPPVLTALEWTANAVNLGSILLAGRNSVHTWWTGVIGCALFGAFFLGVQLYADATLQLFFIATSAVGWWRWQHGASGAPLSVRRTPARVLAACVVAATIVTLGYGWLLHRFTDAYAPYVDSIVLSCSVVAQLLLMGRRRETWPFWLMVNTVAVPLYLARGATLTAVLYAGFWVNALLGWRHWHRLARSPAAEAVKAETGR